MRPLGLILVGWGDPRAQDRPVEPLAHSCYYYGDGDYDISISNEFLRYYLKRGFSLRSLCLALQSSIGYNPETGKKVASYQLVDPAILDNTEKTLEYILYPGLVSEVLPIDVPDCFKRGLPFHDCNMKFDVKTGKRLSTKTIKAISSARAALDKHIAKPVAAGELNRDCSEISESDSVEDCNAGIITMEYAGGREATTPYKGLRPFDTWPLSNSVLHLNEEIPEDTPGSPVDTLSSAGVTLIDISTDFPLGYGYHLFTNGAAAPEGGDPDTAKDPSRRASEQKLQAIIHSLATEEGQAQKTAEGGATQSPGRASK